MTTEIELCCEKKAKYILYMKQNNASIMKKVNIIMNTTSINLHKKNAIEASPSGPFFAFLCSGNNSYNNTCVSSRGGSLIILIYIIR